MWKLLRSSRRTSDLFRLVSVAELHGTFILHSGVLCYPGLREASRGAELLVHCMVARSRGESLKGSKAQGWKGR